MELRPNLIQQTSQIMTITPQVIQSLRLLTYGQEELATFLREQEEKNPLIEVVGGHPGPARTGPEAAPMASRGPGAGPAGGAATALAGDLRGIEDLCAATVTLRDHLLRQVELSFRTSADKIIATEIVESLEPDGYLRRPLHAIADALGVDETRAEDILTGIHGFEPVGVGARDLRECLRLQIRDQGLLSPAMETMLDHLDLVARCDHARLMRLCQVTEESLGEMLRALRSLDPRPGLEFDQGDTLPALPDLTLDMAEDGSFRIELNTEFLPRVLVDREYYAEVRAATKGEDDTRFLVDCMKDANWLTRNLDQRANTILRVATEMVRRQRDFFVHGADHLKPLVQNDIAEAVGMHPSTICRATSNKYILTNRGMIELKALFSNALSASDGGCDLSAGSVRARIGALVQNETARSVLSDEAIARTLRAEGVDIARRTVAKYRDLMRIPSSQMRRRQKRARALEKAACSA